MLPESPIALVTGAGSGIGRELAMELSRRGASLILVGRRQAALEQTREKLSFPVSATGLPMDVTDAADRKKIVEAVEAFERLDLLVNNAGVLCTAPFAETGDAAMEDMLATNILAPFALTRDLLPLLQLGTSPRIVNVGSMFGDIAFPHFVGYSATKFALRGLSDGLRRELKPHGIGVTYAAPRATKTEALSEFAHLVAPFAMKLDDPVTVARQIVNAAAAGRRSVYPVGMERLFILIARLFPGLVDRSIVAQLARIATG